MLSNMSNGIAATETALTSSGSAMVENSKYLDSINGRIAKLGASLEKLSSDTVNSGFLKGLVDIGIVIIDIIDKIGFFNVALLTAATIIGVKGAFGIGATFMAQYLTGIATGLGAATNSAVIFGNVVSALFPAALILLAVAAITKYNDVLANTVKIQQDIVDKATETIDKNEKEINSLTSLQKSLREARGNKESLLAISSSLNEAIGDTPGLLEDEGKAYEIANQLIRDRIELLKNETKAKKEEKFAAQKDLFKNEELKAQWYEAPFTGSGYDTQEAYRLYKLNVEMRKMYLDQGMAEDSDSVKRVDNQIDKFKTFLMGKAKLLQDVYSDFINQTFTDASSKNAVNSFIEDLILGGEVDPDKIKNKVEEYLIPALENINALKNDLAKAKVEGTPTDEIVDKYINTINVLKTALPQQADYFDKMAGSFIEMAKSTAPITDDLIDYNKLLESSKEKVDKYAKSIKTVSSAFKEQEENGSLTLDTTLSLIESGYAAALVIDEETGKVRIEASIYRDLAKAKYEAEIATLNLSKAEVEARDKKGNPYSWMTFAPSQELDDINTQIALYKDLVNNLDKVIAGTYGDKPEKTKVSKEDPYKDSVESKIDDLRYLLDMGKVSEAEYLNELDTLNNKYYKNLAKYKEESRRLDVEIYKGRNQLADQAARDEEKRAEEAKKRQEENIKKDQDAIDHRIQYYTDAYAKHKDENKLVADLESILKFVNISEEQRLEIIKKIAEIRKNEYSEVLSDYENENFLLEKKSGTEQKRIDNYRKMQETVHAEAEKLRSQGFSESSSEVQSLIRLWWEYEDNIEGILTGLNDKITQNLKNSLDEQAKLIQSQIDDLTQEQNDLQNALNYVLSTIDSQISALENEKKLLQENNDESERAITLAKLQNALTNARNNKNVRVYDSAQGWIWTNDAFKEAEAQSAIDEFNKAESLRKEIAGIDARIDAWNSYKSQWQKISSDYELSQNSLIAKQMLGASIESQVLAQRTSAVETFGQKYLATIEAIKIAQSELNDIQNQITNVDSGGTSIGGSGKIAPIAYNPDIDYQAEINKVLKKMADASPEEKKTSAYYNNMEELIRLETLRNSKIKQEKLPYEQTSIYGGQTFANGSDSVPQTGISLVGENGAEYRIINKGDGILSANVTRTLKSFGSNPLQFITSRIPQISSLINNKTTSSQTHYHFGDVVLPNANDFPSFVSGLQLYVDTHKA